MNIFAFVGASDCGKTLIIEKLITEFKRRGYSVAAVKHCPHGFEIEPKAKDSWRLFKEGADPVILISPQQTAVFQQGSSLQSIKSIVSPYLGKADIVLVEGGKNDKSLKKIEVLRRGLSEELKTNFDELIAVVSDFKVDVPKPVFAPSEISRIADFLENKLIASKQEVALKIDGSPIRLNRFVQKIFKKTLWGMISSLEGIKSNPESIILTLSFDKRKNEKEQN